MSKILSTFIFPPVLILSFTCSPAVFSQTESPSQTSMTEDDSVHSARWLRNDLKASDVVLYVDVTSRKLAEHLGDGDCEQKNGTGYCVYLLKAEVKEVFKGKVEKQNFEFYTVAEAGLRKENFLLGEQLVFLVWSDNYPDKKATLSTIENSSLPVSVLPAMRKIVDPEATIDETDENEPYSLKSIEKDFDESEAIVYADVTGFKPAAPDSGIEAFILKARIIEIFKGRLKAGQEIEFKSDYLYRPARDEDLGKQVIYLEKNPADRDVKYRRAGNAIGDVRHDILEKLRQIAARQSNKED